MSESTFAVRCVYCGREVGRESIPGVKAVCELCLEPDDVRRALAVACGLKLVPPPLSGAGARGSRKRGFA